MRQVRIRIEAGILMSPDSLTGVGYYTDRLTRAFLKTHDVELFYGPFYRTKDPEAFNRLPGIIKKCIKLSYRLYRKLDSHNLALPCDIFARKVDVTLFPANFSTWRTINSQRSMVTIHDLTFRHLPESMEAGNLAHLQRVVGRAVKQADVVITVSNTIKQELIDSYGLSNDQVVVTPVPPDPEVFFATPRLSSVRQKYGIPTEKYLLFVGTLEPRKNLPTLINAFTNLSKKFQQEYSLILAGGKGWRSETIENTISEANRLSAGKVVAIGRFDKEDSSALIQHASLLCIPSVYEGFGMPILEAAACETPVIASDIPVLREAAGAGALFANPKSAPSFTQAIERLLSDPELQKKLVKQASVQLKKISWDNNIKVITNKVADKSEPRLATRNLNSDE